MTGRVELAGHFTARSVAAAGSALAQALYATKAYQLTLRGPMPDTIAVNPPELRPARTQTGEDILAGLFSFAGSRLKGPPAVIFRLDPPSPTFAEALHGFGWLRHVAATPDQRRTQVAQTLVQAWLDACGTWHPVAWQPHVSARRLMAWSTHGGVLLEGADLVYRSTVLRSMAAQARHLARTAGSAPAGAPRLTAAIGLAISGVTLTEGRARRRRGLKLVIRELDRQMLPDGGHISRNPRTHLELLTDLICLRDALIAAQVEVPAKMLSAIDRALPMLRFFRHGDGRLALFNGADEGMAGAVDAVLARDDAKGRPFGHAPHSGFQRAAAKRTLLIVDAGAPPRPTLATQAHAGCLSFELSAGRHRLIVNCGPSHLPDTTTGPAQDHAAAWSDAARATAAHSTLTVADTSSARLLRAAWLRRMLGPQLINGPTQVVSTRTEDKGGVRLAMRHDGYVRPFGLVHERRIYLSADGDDLHGEDRLVRVSGRRARWRNWLRLTARKDNEETFCIRFHLHPDARASLAHDGTSILALLPNRDGWQFRSHGDVQLDDSIYMGQPGPPRRSTQIVLTHRVFRGEARVEWRFQRLTTRNAGTAATTPEQVPEQTDAFAPNEDGA